MWPIKDSDVACHIGIVVIFPVVNKIEMYKSAFNITLYGTGVNKRMPLTILNGTIIQKLIPSRIAFGNKFQLDVPLITTITLRSVSQCLHAEGPSVG
ncbi:hypothetical protein [Pseudomonas sp. Pf153]|uniref:hypothetical protein n=1 Tax=Pseudomonas sp. Pf153 TaxID=1699309 RepID=UPI00069D09A1|nr:hypothetical protein [Pseudomonas sp. Pf153]